MAFSIAVPTAYAATQDQVLGFIRECINEGIIHQGSLREAQEFFNNNPATSDQLTEIMGHLNAARDYYREVGRPGLANLSVEQYNRIAKYASDAAAVLDATGTYADDGTFKVVDSAGRTYEPNPGEPFSSQTGSDMALPIGICAGVVALLGGSFMIARKRGLLQQA
jgi:hypothetical protein